MNNNLPEIKREGIFTKIKKWFKSLLGIGKIIEEPVQEAIKEIVIDEVEREIDKRYFQRKFTSRQ